jgi:hypothetical protein
MGGGLLAGPDGDDDDEENEDGHHDGDHLDVLPPVLALQRRCRLLELRGALLESRCG